MPSFGFLTAGYQTRGLVAASQAWINLYIEKIQTTAGVMTPASYAAYCTPGKQLLVTLSDAPVSCLVSSNDFFYAPTTNLFFAMAGHTLFAITATYAAGAWTGTATTIASAFPSQTINGTGGQLFPTTIIVINPTLLFVVAVGAAYVVANGGVPSSSTIGAGGAGYVVGDTGLGSAPVAGGIPFRYIVTSIGTAGAVTGFTLTFSGVGYSVSTNQATATGGAQPGVGSGFQVNLPTIIPNTWIVQQQQIPDNVPGNYINSATWQDGYVIVSMAPTSAEPLRRQFYISGLYSPTSWNALDFDTKEASSDPVVAVFSVNQKLGVFGSQTIEQWYDSGNVLSAFARTPGGGVIDFGLAQVNAVCKIAGTVAWLDSNARGQYVMRIMQGNTPTRISNHALEDTWSQYNTAGMSLYSYVENGHEFLCAHFPIPDRTWVWDSTIGPELGWHQRAYWDGLNLHADIGRYHAFFPQIGHAVGDYRNGNIYLQSLQYLQDNCHNIRRIRIAPHLNFEKKRCIYDRAKMHMLMGLVPATGPGSAPVCSLSLSDDGGQNYGNPLQVALGTIGQTKKVAEWFHLGYSRDRVFKWECAEPIDIVLLDMYVDFRQGFN